MRLSQRIEYILKAWPHTRDSDKDLLIMYWQAEGMNLTQAQVDKFRGLKSPESIRRTRQKIQEAGEYRGTKYREKQVKGKIVQHEIRNTQEPAQLFDTADQRVFR